MTDQNPNSNSPVDPRDWREARQQRREERRARRGGSSAGAWIFGLLLVLLGVAFLLENVSDFTIPVTNWWSLFILIGAVGAFERAYRSFRNAGNHWTASARGAVLLGLVLTLVTAAFLFNIEWTYFGPAIIILAGVGILLNALLPGKE